MKKLKFNIMKDFLCRSTLAAVLCAVVLSLLLLPGCRSKEDEKIVGKEGINGTTLSSEEGEAGEEETTEETKAPIRDDKRILNERSPEAVSILSDIYSFTAGGIAVTPGAEAEPVIRALPEPAEVRSVDSPLYAAPEKIYVYEGFEIRTTFSENKNIISSVFLTDEEVRTPEGIGLASSAAEVEEAYGEADLEEAGQLIWQGESAELHIVLADDQVVSCSYRLRRNAA